MACPASIAPSVACNGSKPLDSAGMIRYMRVHGTHPQVQQIQVVQNAYIFVCPVCGGEFYVKGAHVQPDGTLRCRKCSEVHWPNTYEWCPQCRTAKPFTAFEPQFDRDSRLNRARWCLKCAAAETVPRTPAKTCDHCHQEFTPARRDAKFCSGRCRVAAHRASA